VEREIEAEGIGAAMICVVRGLGEGFSEKVGWLAAWGRGVEDRDNPRRVSSASTTDTAMGDNHFPTICRREGGWGPMILGLKSPETGGWSPRGGVREVGGWEADSVTPVMIPFSAGCTEMGSCGFAGSRTVVS